MRFSPGDAVHVDALGTGVVREVLNGGRYRVELKGRSVVAGEGQLTLASGTHRVQPQTPAPAPTRANVPTSFDLHGKTVEEALSAVDAFINDALLAGYAEIRVIHGRSGGRLKSAVHRRLKELTVVRAFQIDPANAGVTIVTL